MSSWRREPAPLPLEPDVILLPAPCTTSRPGRDLTEWMTGAATPDGSVRIGLAHGPIQEFSEDATATNVIAPNRAALAGLDYMALGDWHGSVAVDARTYYSGAPEPDRFKHDRPGQAMIVSIAGQGALPTTTAVRPPAFPGRHFSLRCWRQKTVLKR